MTCDVSSGCEDCTGDQYFRLFNSDDVQVAYNDDSCGACSVVEYFTTEASQPLLGTLCRDAC